MSIDYDRLREWLAEVDEANPLPGDTITFTYPGNTVEIIRELLHLRDGIEMQRDINAHAAKSCRVYDGPAARAVENNLETVALALTLLLNGDIE